ncbi:hypothetical protein LB553_20165 [Mesorhizobium sp. CA8]|uniref:hypothetical protein n=1 Tax=Mesorhizobium sp. CA8 TaxID=2876637 RepID=UPI001CC94141|nr:hypothetical protein [Mesorhizobium sp. CA8]MBZ9763180.1 hypothetical protein [Mesorhizobium sp. CA8]
MKRSTDRLLALAMLIVGIASFAKLYPALGGGLEATTRLEVLGAAGLLSILAGLLFLAGLLPGAARHDPAAPLFGRDAEVAPAGHPRLRRAALALPLLALIVIVADQFGPWRTQELGGEEAKGVATAPADPAPRPPEPEASAQPTTPEASTKPNTPEASVEPAAPASAQEEAAKPPLPEPVAAPVQPAQTAAPPAESAPPRPAQPAEPVQPTEQTALAPATPPQTEAPPPPAPPARPTALEGHRDAVVWLAVSADGHQILSASTDRMIKLWDIDGKRLIRDLGQHKDMARTALFMPDGRTRSPPATTAKSCCASYPTAPCCASSPQGRTAASGN